MNLKEVIMREIEGTSDSSLGEILDFIRLLKVNKGVRGGGNGDYERVFIKERLAKA